MQLRPILDITHAMSSHVLFSWWDQQNKLSQKWVLFGLNACAGHCNPPGTSSRYSKWCWWGVLSCEPNLLLICKDPTSLFWFVIGLKSAGPTFLWIDSSSAFLMSSPPHLTVHGSLITNGACVHCSVILLPLLLPHD